MQICNETSSPSTLQNFHCGEDILNPKSGLPGFFYYFSYLLKFWPFIATSVRSGKAHFVFAQKIREDYQKVESVLSGLSLAVIGNIGWVGGGPNQNRRDT